MSPPRTRTPRPPERRVARSSAIGLPLALIALVACGPRIKPGPSAQDIAATPPAITIEPERGQTIGVRLLAGGSRWDPPGLEGSTAGALLAAARRDDLDLTLGRDASELALQCDDPPDRCVERLMRALREPAPPLPPDDPGFRAPTLFDETLRIVFEGHPYQHPPVGPRATREALAAHHLDAARERFSRRAVVHGFAADATLADALAQALARLPATPPPDPAMMGPPRNRDSQLFVQPTSERDRSRDDSAYGIAIGGAPPRSALDRTTLELVDIAAQRGAAACARDILQTAGLIPAGAQLGPPLRHPAIIVAVEGAGRLQVEHLVAELPHAWPLLRLDALRICPEHAALLHEAWPERALTVLVQWPAGVEDPWRASVPPTGYDRVHRPRPPEVRE